VMNCHDGGGSIHLWNVGMFQWDHTAQHPIKLCDLEIAFYQMD
jgi:hypothetical protein